MVKISKDYGKIQKTVCPFIVHDIYLKVVIHSFYGQIEVRASSNETGKEIEPSYLYTFAKQALLTEIISNTLRVIMSTPEL